MWGLEERRWLQRTENREDRREAFLSLTRAGLQAYARIISDMLAFEARIGAALGPTKREAVLAALSALEAMVAHGPVTVARSDLDDLR